jgi:NTE family protein
MDWKNIKIGLALSGGGIRAVAFHSGVLKKLAEEKLLENITDISTVSGGSLLTGLIYSLNENRWPTSEEFLTKILPQIEEKLTSKNLEIRLFIKSILFSLLTFRVWKIFSGKANVLSTVLKNAWNIKSTFNDLARKPCWHVNSACYESGKRWRFKTDSDLKMGDYKTGYTKESKVDLSDVMACSAAFPILIGTFVLNTKKYEWFRYSNFEEKELEKVNPDFNKLHLWDGGVYDNNGIEALFKENKFQSDFNLLIISEASAKIKDSKKNNFLSVLRLIDILMNQVRSVKTRDIMNYFENNKKSGLYFQIGNTAGYIQESALKTNDKNFIENNVLSECDVEKASDYPTRLFKMKKKDFDLLVNHGYEVAHYTIKAYL